LDQRLLLPGADVPAHAVQADTRRAILAGIVGNVLEWYDFAVYGNFAAISFVAVTSSEYSAAKR